MPFSATYVCPVRGLADLEPPDPEMLFRAGKTARALGIDHLVFPVLEDSLLGPPRSRVRFLDGLVTALDRVSEAGLGSWLIGPAGRVLGLDWAPPFLVKGSRDPSAPAVFVGGDIRNLHPLDWWRDPALIQKRITVFRELVSAVAGHPSLQGWILLDRALEWARPETDGAEFVLRSLLAELRDRDESTIAYLGLGCSELLSPEMSARLSGLVDGLWMSGMETGLSGLPPPSHLEGEVLLAAYLAAMCLWLYGRPVVVEIGWNLLRGAGDREQVLVNLERLASQGIGGVHWLTLVDPRPGTNRQPPWSLHRGLERAGLLDYRLEPKEGVDTWLAGTRLQGKTEHGFDFIDLSRDDFLLDPRAHLARLRDHFLELGGTP